MIRGLMFQVFIWLGSKLWTYVDICSPDQEVVKGITFSNDEDYINKISEVE
jgi:hypothetical protein